MGHGEPQCTSFTPQICSLTCTPSLRLKASSRIHVQTPLWTHVGGDQSAACFRRISHQHQPRYHRCQALQDLYCALGLEARHEEGYIRLDGKSRWSETHLSHDKLMFAWEGRRQGLRRSGKSHCASQSPRSFVIFSCPLCIVFVSWSDRTLVIFCLFVGWSAAGEDMYLLCTRSGHWWVNQAW